MGVFLLTFGFAKRSARVPSAKDRRANWAWRDNAPIPINPYNPIPINL